MGGSRLAEGEKRGLEAFGFEIAEESGRGPLQRSASRTECHFIAAENEFELRFEARSRNLSKGVWRNAARVSMASVDHLRLILLGFSMEKVPSREVVAALIAAEPSDSPYRELSVDEAMGGRMRAAFYFPRFYMPSLVLALYFGAISREGRALRLRRAKLERFATYLH